MVEKIRITSLHCEAGTPRPLELNLIKAYDGLKYVLLTYSRKPQDPINMHSLKTDVSIIVF